MCVEVDSENAQNGKGRVLSELPEPYNPENRPTSDDTLRTPSHETELVKTSLTKAASKGNPIEDVSVSS
ncbi:hypothetical protein TVAG_455520 [Trichomonas vaginalis G3]|uniref:Uncharacterized protein n=1 Tax=Trichomonas vaginalis (strain ATCC PRA-98 / G3) TaxID=412133 RepID=A2FW91_TRIV3|nr:hypothetical protein TVAGG3_0537990 [Trichomonas vaginalis G3]EAX90824.1 hypothetical protein TVAG_455520 [Trichomonas vaginalis G3]KAI5519625.1 hypothetical protein TVAGG3_0537990 [Trichomonas vaginalis G3]|eukprot:XP_001303754.1 hypothetical protein [Trichomonas vaginalis G3]